MTSPALSKPRDVNDRQMIGAKASLGAEPSFNPEILRQQPDIPCRNDWTSAANRASVSSVDVALFASSLDPAPLAIPPLWGFGGDGACAVATERI
jgi:hypothetical protein